MQDCQGLQLESHFNNQRIEWHGMAWQHSTLRMRTRDTTYIA